MDNKTHNETHTDTRNTTSAINARITAAAEEVHRNLGPGFEEDAYLHALEREFPAHRLEYRRGVWMDISYKGEKVGQKRVDFFVGDSSGVVMVEIEAKVQLEEIDFIHALSSLRASGYQVGLLINFGGKRLEVRRLAN